MAKSGMTWRCRHCAASLRGWRSVSTIRNRARQCVSTTNRDETLPSATIPGCGLCKTAVLVRIGLTHATPPLHRNPIQYQGDAPASPQDIANKNATAYRVGVLGRDRRASAGRRRGDGARQTRRYASGTRSGIPRRRTATRIGCGWRGRRRGVARRER